MKEPKYYFALVRMSWTYYNSDNKPISRDESEFQIVLDVHPLEWQIEYNKQHEKMEFEGQPAPYSHASKIATVVSWQRLTLVEYKKFKNIINEYE